MPKFFMLFMQHIEKMGLDIVGIYRLSGNAASVNKLRYLVEQGSVCGCAECVGVGVPSAWVWVCGCGCAECVGVLWVWVSCKPVPEYHQFSIIMVFCTNTDQEINLDSEEWSDINIVTGCLKLYLRELPDPLVPFRLYKPFIDAASMWISNVPLPFS